MKKALVFLSLICCLAYSIPLYADDQKPGISFYYRQLDNRNGLSNSAINAILQDKDELLWIGTWDGLNRYDGARFSVYNHNIDKVENSIGSNVIQAISEDQHGNIWINTIGGISRYHKITGKFYRYFYQNTTTTKVTENEYKLAINAQGDVFCSAADGQLSKYDPTLDKFVNYQKFTGAHAILKMQFLNNQLWYLTKNESLCVAEPTKNGLKTIKTFNLASGIGNFFVVNRQVVLSLNNEDQYQIGVDLKVRQLDLGKRKIRSIAYYQSYYIIAWENQGVNVFDSAFQATSFLSAEINRLANAKVTTLNVSKDRVLWVGTDGNGLIQVYPKDNYFGLLTKIGGTAIDKPIRAFAENQGNLWVGTKGSGVLIFNNFWQTSAATAKPQKIDMNTGLENNSVFAIKNGIDGLTYIGTDGKGISVYDQKSKKTINWKAIKGTAQLPDFKSVYAIIQDPDSAIWLGTSGYGLIHFKLSRNADQSLTVKNFKQYYSSAIEKNGPANDIIYALAKGKDKRLWIACRYGGLSVFDVKSQTFKTFKAFGYKGSLSHSDVLSLFYDSKNCLWIGTSYGLNYLSYTESLKAKPTFGKITMDKGGLPNNTIHAIQEDGNGNIWLSTNKGLAKVNPSNNSIANYQESDGLQSNEFSDGAVFKAANNYLLFGGIYGFNYFMPKDITENTRQPNLLISELQLGGKEFENNQYLIINAKQHSFSNFELERKSNFFQFALNAVNYFNASKNEFAYKLKGLDQTWRYTGTDGKIAYYNIPPGNYELLVRWSNGEGVWTKDVVALSLHVKQYFWLTYPAYFVYFILLVISGYAFHRYRKNKLEMSFKLERESLFRQKDEEAHRQRINFFTNIAHEIQTPLTLILGSVEHFMQQQHILQKPMDKSYFLSLMHQHTARLTYLVQQLLEFRKAEAGYLKRNDDYLDITKMLNSLTQLFVPAAERNEQQFVRHIQQDITGFIDKDKYEKILFNLLSNAFKHTGAGADIIFTVNYDANSQLLETIVANSGCTLKEADLENIFTEFHIEGKNKFEKFSTGIGLAFTKGLIEVLEGTIQVDLKEDWIYFTVKFELNTKIDHQKDEVVASAPSYLFESILKPYQNFVIENIEESNKHTLIDDLQDKAEYSILIVEDDVALRFLLKNILKDQYNVYEAENGLTAINFLKNNTPDLIISDVMMPDMDGLEFCTYVKTAPATSHIPFIMLSARDGEEHKTEGYETGADAYIPKPFHISYLQVRVRKLLDYRNRMNNLIKDGNINNQFIDADLEQGDKEFLNALVKAVEENLSEPDLDAAKLENALSISKMQLYRKLKAIAGMTPSEFIKRIRLKHAAVLLQNSKLTVSEIFYLTGFNNKSYFFREFKKIYHLAPNDYRLKQHTGTTATNR
ncbi:hybrid sensor histidine kinase/response regulator transcription factor [Pedobacter sp. Hv1]|uniref:hybrid sensor histidine kinase/response regulator transcription factor n=1 Tax=Pedobacter sp. Hv1 TaxID=1740090 RepID=UPI0006D8AF69|nr:hybrid sensor histidine kinase/response regulator transcription factor [Pedobacter sp. Hv1]KQC00410.1 histidine kinase [Pedobacter sp. Hv1]